MRLVGCAVEVAISYALRNHQAADLQRIPDTIEWSRSEVDGFVFDSHKKLTASSWWNQANLPRIPRVLDETLASQKPTVKFHGPGGLCFLLLALPLWAKGGRLFRGGRADREGALAQFVHESVPGAGKKTIPAAELRRVPANLVESDVSEAQARLLTVLESGKVRPLGGTAEVPVEVRVIAATNRTWSCS